jgi:hypothetical protein
VDKVQTSFKIASQWVLLVSTEIFCPPAWLGVLSVICEAGDSEISEAEIFGSIMDRIELSSRWSLFLIVSASER